MLSKELMKKYMVISDEVQEAMDSGKPIVAFRINYNLTWYAISTKFRNCKSL